MKPTIFFHSTTAKAARKILAAGFRDATGTYGMGIDLTGVWVSTQILDRNEGTKGDEPLRIEIEMSQEQLNFYEIIEDGRPFREWCIPARILNKGKISRITQLESAK